MIYDLAIVGGGPAGSTCAAFSAANGLRTIVLEREKFPREKVCGDCINPSCWPVLERLKVDQQIHETAHGALDRVEFINLRGQCLSVKLPRGGNAEIAIKRSIFDFILLDNARRRGADVRHEAVVRAIARSNVAWQLTIDEEMILTRFLGSNASVLRCKLTSRYRRISGIVSYSSFCPAAIPVRRR
jgi:menaquinone-9 beta-reductase